MSMPDEGYSILSEFSFECEYHPPDPEGGILSPKYTSTLESVKAGERTINRKEAIEIFGLDSVEDWETRNAEDLFD